MQALGSVRVAQAVGEGGKLVGLQPRLDRVKWILCAVSRVQALHRLAGPRTAANVDNRLLELAASSVRYFLAHRRACSLRSTALDTPYTSRCPEGCPSPCAGMGALASGGAARPRTAMAMGPGAGQAPSRPPRRAVYGRGGGR